MTTKPAARPASLKSALSILTRIRDEFEQKTCIVAYSGGKDSWASISMAHRIFGKGNVHAYNLYLVPELECELREIRKAERRYGFAIHRLPHPGIQSALSSGHLRTKPILSRRQLQHSDIYQLIRNLTGSDWIIFGHRMDESLQRRGMIKASEGVFPHLRKCYPIYDWKAADVFHYLKTAGIPAPEQYTEDDTTGLTLGPQTLLYLRSKYPDDYRRIIELFPLAESQFIREHQRIQAGLGPTHYSIKRKRGLMETLNEFIEGQFSGEISGKISGSDSSERTAEGTQETGPQTA